MGPQLGVKAVPVEVAADEPLVIEHAVQHHPDAPGPGGGTEVLEVLVGTQHGVHPLVVGGAVAVILRRLEDGAEVEGLHPQTLEIVQLFLHPRQRAAEEIPVAHLAAGIGLPHRLLEPAGVNAAPPHHAGGIGHTGAAEAVGEDLIGDALSKPGRNGVGAVVDGELPFGKLQRLSVQPLQAEGVPDQAHIVPGVQRTGKEIPVPVQPCPRHGHFSNLLPPELKPRPKHGPGPTTGAAGAEGEGDPGPGGHRPIGSLAPGVSCVEDGGIYHGINSQIKNGGATAAACSPPPRSPCRCRRRNSSPGSPRQCYSAWSRSRPFPPR